MKSMDVYNDLKAITLDEFAATFSSFSKSAFRLELLNTYIVDSEAAAYQEFLSGRKAPPHNYNADWCNLIRNARLNDKKFQRVRLVEEPISSYLQFEISWAYRANIPAGEEIRTINDITSLPCTQEVPILKDFWIFDENRCYLMEYDFRGTFLGVSELPNTYISPYLELKSLSIKRSIDIRDTKLWGLYVEPSY